MKSLFLTLCGAVAPAVALQGLPVHIGSFTAQRDVTQRLSAQAAASYKEYNLSVPIDHFHNESIYEPHSDGNFNLRYWFDAQFYKPGGPVFVLGGGETDGEGRLPYLEKGIVHEIAKATNGVGVILEHRYYGKSVPTPDFSTENLRFLTTEQALADTAFFAQNVKFEAMDTYDLSPESTPWIAYGGSYAGAFVAFLRVVYPDIFFGAISSSGVPAAIWDYWEYYEAARIYGPPVCSETQGKLTNIVDKILMNETNARYIPELKEAFDKVGVSDNTDFASSITRGITALQSYNWDPEQSSDYFFTYCDTISNNENQFPDMESKRDFVEEIIAATGYADESDPLTDRMLNYMGTQQERGPSAQASADYYRTSDVGLYAQDDLSQTWRLWVYQVCTEWGFLQTGSGAPDDILPMISRLVDLEYSSQICKDAFNITKIADLDRINRYGSFNISYPRLAFVDGEWDPWRAAGVHALTQPKRDSTTSEPMILIDDAVHHWDENGVFPNETRPGIPPPAVRSAKCDIRKFVKAWLKDAPQARSYEEPFDGFTQRIS